MVGNPGSGKSTILNSLAEEVIFQSGISIGQGLTTRLQTWERDGAILIDTPGLEDVAKKTQAGKELDKMLAQNIPIKIVFVVTLEHGRVRPADCVTIDLVLSAIKSADTDNKFGVVINQASPGILRRLEARPDAEALLRKQLTKNRSTSHWFKIAFDRSLEDADNGQINVTDELVMFLRGVPATKPANAIVKEIDTQTLDDKVEEQIAYIRQLEAAGETQRKLMMARLEQQRQEAEERNAEMMQLMKRVKRSKKEKVASYAAGTVGVAGTAVLLGCTIQ